MDGLDRLGWAEGLSLVAYGVRVGVRANSPDAMARARQLLPPSWRPALSPDVKRLYSLVLPEPASANSRVRRYSMLYANARRIARDLDGELVLRVLESELQLYVAERARRRLFVHAGVVGWDGRAIVLPGRTLSGKSTLVAALLRAGATYYSDEYAVLDVRGRVHPYPRQLSLREDGSLLGTKFSPEMLGARSGKKPLPVGLVAVTEYREGARWRPGRLSPGRAVLALLAHTVQARRRPEFALAVLRTVVADALVLKGVRGEAHEVAEWLLEASAWRVGRDQWRAGRAGRERPPGLGRQPGSADAGVNVPRADPLALGGSRPVERGRRGLRSGARGGRQREDPGRVGRPNQEKIGERSGQGRVL